MPEQSWLEAFEERAASYEAVRLDAKREITNAVHILEEWLTGQLALNFPITEALT
jgi:hypothetical protein